jgi:hypothetical protein
MPGFLSDGSLKAESDTDRQASGPSEPSFGTRLTGLVGGLPGTFRIEGTILTSSHRDVRPKLHRLFKMDYFKAV